MKGHATVSGVGFTQATSVRRQTKSKGELCRQAVDSALEHAGRSRRDVDAVMWGDIAGFEASNVSSKTLGLEIGLPPSTPIFSISTGGTSGGHLANHAATLVRSGAFNRILCVGPPTFDGPVDLQAVINTNSPMIMEQPLGMGATHMGAFFASAYQARYGLADSDFQAVAEKNRENAAHNPYAHLREAMSAELANREVALPLRFGMICPVSSGACSILVEREDLALSGPNPPVRFVAYGSISDGYLGGTRGDFAAFEALSILADRVYQNAHIEDARSDFDLLELFCPYAPYEFMLMEAVGAAEYGTASELFRRGATRYDGALPVNVSGGIQCTNSGVGGQLSPVGYAALQLMGQAAGDLQVRPARRALAHSMGGTFFQFHTLTVLESLSRG